MLVKKLKFRRNSDQGGFHWRPNPRSSAPASIRGFTAVGKTLADVKEFAALVRWCERTGTLERLSEMHPDSFEKRMQPNLERSMVYA